MHAEIKLRRGKDESPKRFHPWIFSGAIQHKPNDLLPGDVVEVLDFKGNYIGTGLYSDGSIAIRLISFEQTNIDSEFWETCIANAWNYRNTYVFPYFADTNTYRLFYGEGDGIPGLVLDVYGKTAVFQAHNLGVYKHREAIAQAIIKVSGGSITAVYDKSKEALPQDHSHGVNNGYLIGDNGAEGLVTEYGNQFKVNWVEGQKTGFFIDQRENRKILASYAKDKTILNTFCYTGGFSIFALNAGAKAVHSVDVSAKAVALTEENVQLSGFSNQHEAHVADTFDFLKANDNTYDIIVLDPPAFIKNIKKRHKGLIGYKRINEMAIRQIKKGGLLFTFSCSQAMTKQLFQSTVMAAAIEVGRKARVIQHLEQPTDHPSNIYHPEGEYLKGLILEID